MYLDIDSFPLFLILHFSEFLLSSDICAEDRNNESSYTTFTFCMQLYAKKKKEKKILEMSCNDYIPNMSARQTSKGSVHLAFIINDLRRGIVTGWST